MNTQNSKPTFRRKRQSDRAFSWPQHKLTTNSKSYPQKGHQDFTYMHQKQKDNRPRLDRTGSSSMQTLREYGTQHLHAQQSPNNGTEICTKGMPNMQENTGYTRQFLIHKTDLTAPRWHRHSGQTHQEMTSTFTVLYAHHRHHKAHSGWGGAKRWASGP